MFLLFQLPCGASLEALLSSSECCKASDISDPASAGWSGPELLTTAAEATQRQTVRAMKHTGRVSTKASHHYLCGRCSDQTPEMNPYLMLCKSTGSRQTDGARCSSASLSRLRCDRQRSGWSLKPCPGQRTRTLQTGFTGSDG